MPPPRLGTLWYCASIPPACSTSVSSLTLQFLRALNGSNMGSVTSRPSPSTIFARRASHQAQGRANGPKDSPGKRLGVKKTGGQQVVPGNIIFRQRGTLWFPGENCSMGRDHTIYATQPGYVRFYRDPFRHPKRQYIGVALDKTQTLPTPPNAARRRRLGMVAIPRPPPEEESHTPEPLSLPTRPLPRKQQLALVEQARQDRANPKMSSNYIFREPNWEIGRTAEKEGVYARPWRKDDRWFAWRMRTVKKAKAAKKRSLSARGAKKAKKAKRKSSA